MKIDKVYNVTPINWLHFFLEAKETDLSAADVEESEMWDISFFEHFQIRLENDSGEIKFINMDEYAK